MQEVVPKFPDEPAQRIVSEPPSDLGLVITEQVTGFVELPVQHARVIDHHGDRREEIVEQPKRFFEILVPLLLIAGSHQENRPSISREVSQQPHQLLGVPLQHPHRRCERLDSPDQLPLGGGHEDLLLVRLV